MTRIASAAVLTTYLVAAACGSDSVVGSSLGRSTVLQVGEVAEFAEAGLRVGFTEVSEDSRCPPPDTGIVCIWEGKATVVLWAEKPPEARSEIRLSTSDGPGGISVGHYSGFEIELVSLTPPRGGDQIRQAEYRLTLLVQPAD